MVEINLSTLHNTIPANHYKSIITMFREAGGQLGRWNAEDISIMAYCISRFEDLIELDHPGKKQLRTALRTYRRRLEAEIV